ncbi:hypothetical protein J6590_060418 [Homalodisca vitripennis]|nr:hypothetical protein J6590_060418 [Homalodisca vitripennis]
MTELNAQFVITERKSLCSEPNDTPLLTILTNGHYLPTTDDLRRAVASRRSPYTHYSISVAACIKRPFTEIFGATWRVQALLRPVCEVDAKNATWHAEPYHALCFSTLRLGRWRDNCFVDITCVLADRQASEAAATRSISSVITGNPQATERTTWQIKVLEILEME